MDDNRRLKRPGADNGGAQQKSILVVDDVFSNRILLAKVFSDEYRVEQAENGLIALNKLRESPDYAAIILDIMMPVMDGYAFLAELKKDEALFRIPVVVVTGNGDEQTQIKALNMGAMDVINKPYSPKIVRHRVKSIISRREAEHLAEQSRIYEELLRQSETNRRTGIYNKKGFCRITRMLLEHNPDKQYVLCRWDVDRFKVFNDVFGVAAGEEYLAAIGAAYRALFISPGVVYGHMEADHFVTCVERSMFDAAEAIASLQRFVEGLHTDFDFVVRMGVYEIDDPSLDVALMCDRAYLALRSIKNNYTTRVAYYDESMRAALIEEQAIVAEMRTALQTGQFMVYLQPQYNYASNTLRGAEALVRWKHPQKGMILPGTFIPIFERNGFISKMDEYVWEQVCKQQRRWLDAGISICPVSVNVSRQDIYNPRLCELISGLIKKYRLEPSMLRLEITETAYMDDPGQLISVAKRLRNMGFQVEMDDFGSGYSSLNTLREVPVDMLKLDMKFLRSGDNDSTGGSILSSIIRMANSIKLPVIAEGVETRAQADYLKSIGCIYMQGYHFARPMPVSEYEKLLTGAQADDNEDKLFDQDIEGAAEFLDASTQATLLFNSFVGGAHIIEYDGERVESLRANDRFFETIGCTREEYAGKEQNLLRRFYTDSRKRFIETLQTAIKTGDEASCELHCMPLKPGGQDYWTFNRVRFLARNVQSYIFYLSVENINERKELEDMRLRLADIVQNVPAGIAIYSWDGSDLYAEYVSDRTCEMFGFSREEYMVRLEAGLPLGPLVDREVIAAAVNACLRDKKIDVTIPGKRKDGSSFWMRMAASLVQREGRTPLLYATLFDVTDQYRNEEEREILMDALPGGVVKYSADEQRSISYVSDSLLRMLGYQRESLERACEGCFSKLLHPDDRGRVTGSFPAEGELTGVDHWEFRIRMANGSYKWVMGVRNRVQDADGKGWAYLTLLDIHERKRLEEELRSSKKGK